MNKYVKFMVITLSALFIFALAVPNISSAAFITVDSVADNVVDDMDCTLREAIMAANNDADGNGCTGAGSYGTETIEFDNAILPATITLNGSNIGITSSMNINGPGADQLTISGNNSSRIFVVEDFDLANNQTVDISGLTISEGAGEEGTFGGAIANGEFLILDSCLIDNNSSPFFNGGAIEVFDATGSVSGASLVLIDSTVSNNTTSGNGGAISNRGGTVVIVNSTLTGNSANDSDGGAIFNSSNMADIGTVELYYTTITDNTAGNGGGIVNDVEGANNVVSIQNSIVAGNTDDSGDNNCVNNADADSFEDLGYNIEDENTCDFDNTNSSFATDPLLDPAGLQDNGGATQTIRLLIDSPAVDFIPDGENSCNDPGLELSDPEFDQRGFSRFVDGNIDGTNGCDSGAFELQPSFADLSVEKTDDPDPVVIENTLTYMVTVTNNGPDDATGVTLTDTLPPEVLFDSAPGCSESGGVVECEIAMLANGFSENFMISVTVSGTPDIIANTVEVSGDQGDDDTSNNEFTEFTSVVEEDIAQQSLVELSEEPPGLNCPEGGTRIDTGIDDNGNGTLESGEIDETSYACNGEQGSEGTQTLVETAEEPPGDNCPSGGTRVDTGPDDNSNGTLEESEISDTTYICDGGEGTRTLVETTEEPPGDNCPNGGTRVDTGPDENTNGTLDEDEITDTTYICDGEEGPEGPQGPQGPEGPEGDDGEDADGGGDGGQDSSSSDGGGDSGCSLASGSASAQNTFAGFFVMLLPLFALAIRTARRKK